MHSVASSADVAGIVRHQPFGVSIRSCNDLYDKMSSVCSGTNNRSKVFFESVWTLELGSGKPCFAVEHWFKQLLHVD